MLMVRKYSSGFGLCSICGFFLIVCIISLCVSGRLVL